jgi:hypothetical protein
MQLLVMTNISLGENEKCIYIIHFGWLDKNRWECTCLCDSWCGSWAIRVNVSYNDSFLDDWNSLQILRKFIKNVQMEMIVTVKNVIIVIFD